MLLFSLHASGQVGKGDPVGIKFVQGSIEKAQEQARTTGKPLFVEIYLTGCPHCEALAPVLQEQLVGTFYNQEFVSWKAEANSEESKAFQKLKGVTYPEFPLLFFFAPTGELLHLATPQEQSDRQSFVNAILQIGFDANNPGERTGGYAARLATGEKDVTFLINYGKYVKAVKDPGKLAQINDLLARELATPEQKEGKVGFYVLQHLIDQYNNGLASYFFGHLDTYRARYSAKDVRDAGEAILYHSLYVPAGETYTVQQMQEIRQRMVSLGVSDAEASGRLLVKELNAHFREKDTHGAMQHFDRYRGVAQSMSLPDYAYVMKLFNEKATDYSYLAQVPVWAKRGLDLAKPADLKTKQAAGLYYELAESYRRGQQKAEAQLNAKKALETARLAGDDLKRYEALVALTHNVAQAGATK